MTNDAPQKVWVWVIDSKHGVFVRAFASQAAMNAAAHTYAEEYWEDFVGDEQPMPDDAIDRWDRFSERASICDEYHSFELTEVEP